MKNVFLFIAFLSAFSVSGQKEDEYLNWNATRKLTWDDFKAEAQRIGNTAALTTTHLGFSYNMVNGIFSYTIECRFDKNRSWGLVKNDWILKHEQGHFDIAEIFARKLKRSVESYRFNRNTFQKDLDIIYDEIVKAKEKFQQMYDDETNYSRDKEKQEEWLKKIESELKETIAWSVY
jgi:hypothetical protein